MSVFIVCVFIIPTVIMAGHTNSLLTVQKIWTKNSDETASQFDTFIRVKVGNNNIYDWALGFYMPRTFNTSINSDVNTDLTMTICQSNGNNQCDPDAKQYPLHFVKRSDQHQTFYGTGYSNVLTPNTKHQTLQSNKTYLIKLKGNNQWPPENMTEMPQSFFIIKRFNKLNGGDKRAIPIKTPRSAYYSSQSKPQKTVNIDGYNDKTVKETIEDRQRQHQNHSIPAKDNKLANQLGLVPTPASITMLDHDVSNQVNGVTIQELDKPIHVNINGLALNHAMIKQEFNNRLHKKLTISYNNSQQDATIQIMPNDSLHQEGYLLTISNNQVVIEAADKAGAYYGIQTLELLWYHAQENNNGVIPAVKIQDKPRFQYRGVLLDVSRHFFKIKTIKNLIDAMSAQKLNTLHWHLSDDEGFRLALPALSQKEQYRASTRGYFSGSPMPASKYSQGDLDITNYKDFDLTKSILDHDYTQANDHYHGIYTKPQIKDLIEYANQHQVTIIPEIDLPGHAKALVEASPKSDANNPFVNTKDNSDYISTQGYYHDTLPVCLYGKSNRQGKLFSLKINKIVQQTASLFNDQSTVYANDNEVSLGGDEVSPQAWTNDPSCEGSDNPSWRNKTALQRSQLFFKQLQDQTGISLSGWSQTVQTDQKGNIGQYATDSNNTSHIWVWNTREKGIRNAKKLASNYYPTVIAFADDSYFDLTYTARAWQPGFHWAGHYVNTYAALRSALDASKVEHKLNRSAKRHDIKGIEGTLWSENIMNSRHLGYMAFPKMTGLAEAAWAPESTTVDRQNSQINWASLAKRLGHHNNTHFLGWLYRITDMKYRGFPEGINAEWLSS